jgi:PAS domain S-box-containing protein
MAKTYFDFLGSTRMTDNHIVSSYPLILELPQSQFHGVLNALPDATLVVNESGIIVFASKQVERTFDYKPSELIGKTIETLVPDNARAAHVQHRNEYFQKPRYREFGYGLELSGRRKDGTVIPVEICLGYINNGHGALVISTIRDISERKRAAQLENLVLARTQELETAREQAENANAAKSRFLTAASHDLRQPLQTAGLYLSVLSQLEGSAQHQEICHALNQSLEVMNNLLNALLDISKLESGTVVPNKKNFELDKILKCIITDNLPQAKAKGLNLTCEIEDCTAYSDPALLERIIENFVTNAIRYTQQGQVSVACKCNDGVAHISVGDTGIGIPKNELDNIFNEYYQLDNPGRDRRKGLGLGLAIAKHISNILGHPLSVESMPGQGSVFTVTIPLGQTVKTSVGGYSELSSHDKVHIKPEVLFIDDDPMIISAMRMLFNKLDIPIYTAETSEQAIAQIKSGVRPDVIVSDYRLQGCNGIEVVKQIRELALDTIPAIIISGDTSLNQIENQNLPKSNIFLKPVDAKKLVMKIYEVTNVLHAK